MSDDEDAERENVPTVTFSASGLLPPSRPSLRHRLSASKGHNNSKQTRHLSLFGAGFSSPSKALGTGFSSFSQGNTLSPVPVRQAKKEKFASEVSEQGSEVRKPNEQASRTIWGNSKLHGDGKLYSATQTQKRRRSWLAHRQIKFESASGRPEPEENLKVFLDDLAKHRTQESGKQQRLQKDEAILHHRDSLLGAAAFASRRPYGETLEPAPESPKPRSAPVTSAGSRQSANKQKTCAPAGASTIGRALRKLGIFAKCSEEFVGLLASQCETFRLKPGEFREVAVARKGLSLSARLACAVVVVSGSCRVEVGRRIISECSPGSAYGLANVLAGISQGRTNSSGQQAVDHFTVRPGVSEGCHCVIVTATLLRQTLAHCPHDQAHLQDVLHILNQPVDSMRQILSTLQCSEILKQSVIDGTTRHLFLRGETICKQGDDRPFGLILLRCGVVSIEINGVEVRKVSGCHTIGEEMLCDISPTWGFSATCATHCDVQILHRHLFVPALRDMQNGDTEERSASQRLMYLVDGSWRENKAILAWPLFRGYDQELLTRLGHYLETRVVLSGRKIWEGGPNGFGASGREHALYFLLLGSCEETYHVERGTHEKDDEHSGSDLRKIKRCLVQGACIGSKEFLGCREKFATFVIAKTICSVNVLHRNVFLHVLDGLTNEQKKTQSGEVAHILQDQLDLPGSSKSISFRELVHNIPLFNFSDISCLEGLCELAIRLFCIPGQSLCLRGADMDALFVISRGTIVMKMADLEIKRHTTGDVLSPLSLCVNGFKPSYMLVCDTISEVWSVHRDDALSLLEGFPSEKARVNTLIKAQLREPTKEEQEDDAKASGFLVPVASMKIFHGCSSSILQWISKHLEVCVYFPKQVIVNEQEDTCEDTSFYAICEGQVIGYSNSHNVQVSLVSGNYFGEMRLLGISEHVDTSMQAMEITILQVLHQRVFKRSLELFPRDVEHFEKVMLAGIVEQEELHLSSLPYFLGCNQGFSREIEKLMVTKLVQKGCIIMEKGSAANEDLYIIRTGSAISDDGDGLLQSPAAEALANLRRRGTLALKPDAPSPLPEGTVLNMDTVLGMQRNAQRTIRAVTPCAIVRINAMAFLHVLQRFPSEVMRLVSRSASGGGEGGGEGGEGEEGVGAHGGGKTKVARHLNLWPRAPREIPFLKDISVGLFEILMSISEWHMFLPEQYVLRQGQKGKTMYMLCHGEAAIEADDICIDEAFSGYCFGHRNFLSVTPCYEESLRTVTVSHFRRFEAEELDIHIHDIPGEIDRLQQLRTLVRQAASEESKIRQQKVWIEKLRRRKIAAFRSHVSTVRSNRGILEPLQAVLPCSADEASVKTEEIQDNQDARRDRVTSDGTRPFTSPISSRRNSCKDGFTPDWVSLDTKNKQIASVRNSVDGRRSIRPSVFVTAQALKAASFMQRMKGKKNRLPQGSDCDSEETSNDDSDSVQSTTSDTPSEMWSASRNNSLCASASARNSMNPEATFGDLEDGVVQDRSPLVGIRKQRRAGGVAAYLPGIMGPVSEERPVRRGDMLSFSKGLPEDRRRTNNTMQTKQANKDAVGEDVYLSEGSSASADDKTQNVNKLVNSRSSLPRDGRASKVSKFVNSAKRGTNPTKANFNESDDSFEISVMAPQGVEPGRESLGGDLVEKIFFAKMQAFSNAKPTTKVERIEAAISTHNEGRLHQIERGKILRALHNDRLLPLPGDAESDPRHLYLEQASEKEFCPPVVKMPGKALHQKFKQLTRPRSRACLPPNRNTYT